MYVSQWKKLISLNFNILKKNIKNLIKPPGQILEQLFWYNTGNVELHEVHVCKLFLSQAKQYEFVHFCKQ